MPFPSPLPSPLRRLLRRELLALYAVVCMADVVVGLVLPLFPPLARQLGASIALIGALAAVNGGAQVLSGVPAGLLSDRWGRGRVIAGGVALLVLATLALSAAPSAGWLVLAQAALGVGIVATFVMGAALAADLSAPAERGAVMGMYTTAMGLGFAIGPLFGGLGTMLGGPRGSLLAASGVALVGCLLALLGLPQRAGGPARVVPPRGQLAALASSQPLRLACAANLLFSPIFNAVVVALVPLRGEALGFSAVAIGGLFTIRALVSTGTRLPTGVISTTAWSYRLVLLALALGGAAALALAEARSYPLFAAALAAEGLSYGVFLTAGQAFVAQRVERGSLGAALGAYSTAGGISGALSPFLLGIVADRLGIPAALWLAGAMALLGAAALALRLGQVSLKVFRQV